MELETWWQRIQYHENLEITTKLQYLFYTVLMLEVVYNSAKKLSLCSNHITKCARKSPLNWGLHSSTDKQDLHKLKGDRDMHQCLCSVVNMNAPTSSNPLSILVENSTSGTAVFSSALVLHQSVESFSSMFQFSYSLSQIPPCCAPPLHGINTEKHTHSTEPAQPTETVFHPHTTLLDC